jgi:hypothetical protein
MKIGSSSDYIHYHEKNPIKILLHTGIPSSRHATSVAGRGFDIRLRVRLSSFVAHRKICRVSRPDQNFFCKAMLGSSLFGLLASASEKTIDRTRREDVPQGFGYRTTGCTSILEHELMDWVTAEVDVDLPKARVQDW